MEAREANRGVGRRKEQTKMDEDGKIRQRKKQVEARKDRSRQGRAELGRKRKLNQVKALNERVKTEVVG